MELKDAVKFMMKRHEGQKRIQGTPYYMHPLEVSILLKRKGFNNNYRIAGLFHDLIEDTNTTYEEIESLTNSDVALAVKLVTKEPGYKHEEYIERIKNHDMAKNIKLADRIHNLSEAKFADEKFQIKYIRETEKYYLDLAKGTVFENDLNNTLRALKNELDYER